MREAIRSEAALVDPANSWTTASDAARFEGGAAAQTTSFLDTVILYDFDLLALPTLATITGVAVRIDAMRADSGGTSTLKIGAELSWDSGSSWTTLRYTPSLALTSGTFVLGGPDDTWGHSWTRAELVGASTFRLRITAGADAIVGTPTWHLYFARPTVYYDEAGTETMITTYEPIALAERVVVSPEVIRIYEKLDVYDSGSVPAGQITDRRAQQLKLSGTAITTLQSTSAYPAAALRPQHREAIGCLIASAENDLAMFIGDATLLGNSSSLSYPGTHMQPGLMDMGEISHEASFGSIPTRATCELRLKNRLFVNQRAGASAVPLSMSAHLKEKRIIGGDLVVWSFVQSGESWEQLVIFIGTIEEFDFEESALTIRAVTVGTGGHPVPDVFVDSSLFTYEPGSSGVDTGEEIEGNRGKPVPVGIGRFDYGAIKKPADWPAGHPFRTNNQSVNEHDKVYTQIALLPAMWGLKHPMMPTIHVAKRFRRKNAEVGDLQFTSWPYQNVFLFGSRKSQPHLGCMTGPSPGFANFHFPSRGLGNYSKNGGENQVDLVTIWTWGKSGMPFAVPISGAHYGSGDQAIPFWASDQQGAGTMDMLGYPFDRGRTWSDGTATDCFGVFVNGTSPRAAALFPEIPEYPPPRQVVAIPMSGPTQFETRTKLYFDGPQNPKTPIFQNLEGTGQGFVENFRNAIDLTKVDSYARLQNMGFMSVRLPLDGPRLGPIRGIKVCVAWNSSTTTAVNVYLLARLGPHNNYAVLDASITPDYLYFNKDINTTFNKADLDDTNGGFVHCYKLANLTTATYASMWLLPFFDPVARNRTPMSDTARRPMTADSPATPYATPKSEWNFIAQDFASLTSSLIYDFPWDAMLHVRDLSGGTPIAGRFIDINAIWLEVMYDSPVGEKPITTTVTGSVEERTRFIPWWLINVPVTEGFTEPAFTTGVDEPSGAPIYVTGKGAQDDASGTITGTANAIIEHPADIAQALIRHYAGETVFAARATGSSFGSFTTARTLLGSSYRLTAVFLGGDLKSALEQVARQSMSIIVEDLDQFGDLHWRMFVDTPDPDFFDNARMYRAGTFLFSLDHMAVGTFIVSLTPVEDLASSVRLRFGFHLPSGTWSDEKYCNPTSTNFATAGSNFTAAMAESRRSNGTTRELRVDAPDIWDPEAAEVLAKWHASRAFRQRVVVRFETFANAMDLQVGHVIRIDPSVASHIEYPGLDGITWDFAQFNVLQVSYRKDGGQMARVFVLAEETYPMIG